MGGSRLDTISPESSSRVSDSPPPRELDEAADDWGDDPETTGDPQDQPEESNVEYAFWGFDFARPWNIAGSVAANSSRRYQGTPPPPDVAPEAWVLCSWRDGEVHVQNVTRESYRAMISGSQSSL